MSKRSVDFKNNFRTHKKEYYNDNPRPETYEAISLIFCSMLGLTISDMKNFIKFKDDITNTLYTDKYVIKNKNQYEKLISSLNSAYKAGEDNEKARHLKAEDEAFKRGVKYGREQKENELNIKNKNSNNFNYKVNEKTLKNINDYYNNIGNDFNHIINDFNNVMKHFFNRKDEQ